MSDEAIARAEALTAALVEAGADCPFWHDGLGYFLVPLWVVKAYAAARLERQPAASLMRVMMVAHVGDEVWRTYSPHADWTGWRIARAWAWRMARLEEVVRGAGSVAA